MKKALEFYTRYYIVCIVLLAIVAYYLPQPFITIGSIKILTIGREFFILTSNKLFFVLTMFGIGAVLRIQDFKHIVQNPKMILIGTCAQFTIMPLGAYIFTRLFHLDKDLTVGLILTGCAPGAMASNVMCYLSKADTAYSVSLTTVSTLLCPLITPLLVGFLAASELDISFLQQFFGLFMTVVFPLLLGFAARYYLKKVMQRFLYIFPALSVTFIIFICAYVIAKNQHHLNKLTYMIFTATILLNIYGMTAGYGVGRLFQFPQARCRTLLIEVGMQNAGLGTILTYNLVEAGKVNNPALLPPVIFVFICIITASGLAAVWQQTDRSVQNC